MDQQPTSPPLGQVHAHHVRGRSPSAGHQQPHIRNSHSHSPSPHPYHQPSPESSVGLGLGIDAASVNPQFTTADFSTFNTSNAGSQFMTTSQRPQQPSFSQQGIADTTSFDPSYTSQPQSGFSPNLIAPDFSDVPGDFSLFPPATTTAGDQFNTPLFGDLAQTNAPNLSQSDLNMTSPQAHHSPTPPHLLGADPNSAHQSPSFNQHQFNSPPHHRSHSRNASLGPEAALLSHQYEYSHPQFQGHRRAPSEYSDVSSAGASPNLTSHDTFEPSEPGHSPMQRAQDFYDGVTGFSNFSISDPQVTHSRSPSHSPAISPRISPQQIPDMSQSNQAMLLNTGYPNQPSMSYAMQGSEQFPALTQEGASPGQQAMAPPSINIDFAPNSRQNSFEPPKPQMDQTSLIPPDRGRSPCTEPITNLTNVLL